MYKLRELTVNKTMETYLYSTASNLSNIRNLIFVMRKFILHDTFIQQILPLSIDKETAPQRNLKERRSLNPESHS